MVSLIENVGRRELLELPHGLSTSTTPRKGVMVMGMNRCPPPDDHQPPGEPLYEIGSNMDKEKFSLLSPIESSSTLQLQWSRVGGRMGVAFPAHIHRCVQTLQNRLRHLSNLKSPRLLGAQGQALVGIVMSH